MTGEFQVNTYITGDQYVPRIAATKDGGFVVTWRSYGQDGDNWGIYYACFIMIIMYIIRNQCKPTMMKYLLESAIYST